MLSMPTSLRKNLASLESQDGRWTAALVEIVFSSLVNSLASFSRSFGSLTAARMEMFSG